MEKTKLSRALMSLVMILMTGLIMALPINKDGDSPDDLAKEAQTALSKFNYKKAIKLYTQALKESPDDAELLRARGEVFLTIQKYDPAMDDLMTALSYDLEDGRTYVAMSKLQFEKKEFGDALWFINLAAQYAHDDDAFKDILGFKGKIHLELEEYQQAETNLLEASMADQVSREVLKDLALTYYKLGKNGAAVDLLQEIVDLFGDDMETLVNTGYVCNLIEDYELAVIYFDMALEKEQGQPYALCNKAYSILQLGDVQQAEKLIKRSLENDNTNTYAYKVRGDVYAAQGENEKACKEYRKAVEMGWVLFFDREDIEEDMNSACGN